MDNYSDSSRDHKSHYTFRIFVIEQHNGMIPIFPLRSLDHSRIGFFSIAEDSSYLFDTCWQLVYPLKSNPESNLAFLPIKEPR